MSISLIKPEILLPERELVINKNLKLRQKPAIIASVTEQRGIVKLWIFQEMPDSPFTNIEAEELNECVTNRDAIWRQNSYARVSCGHISEITIQSINLPISQSSYSVVGRDPVTHMKLQHFIEAGVDFSTMENIGFNGLALGEYQLTEGIAFPEIEVKADMPISLTIRAEACEMLVEPTHWFNLKIGEQDIARSFQDPSADREIVYYIDGVVVHDIWKETEERFKDEETLKLWHEQGLDDAAIEQARINLPESLEHICPMGHELLILQYECPDNIQLNFYTTEYLLGRPENTGSSVAVALIGLSNDESMHGYQVRSCLLKTVPVGFSESVEVELISWFKNIPDERVDA